MFESGFEIYAIEAETVLLAILAASCIHESILSGVRGLESLIFSYLGQTTKVGQWLSRDLPFSEFPI